LGNNNRENSSAFSLAQNSDILSQNQPSDYVLTTEITMESLLSDS
jgi:hypothetical protein